MESLMSLIVAFWYRFLVLLKRVRNLSLKTVFTLMKKTLLFADQHLQQESFLRKRAQYQLKKLAAKQLKNTMALESMHPSLLAINDLPRVLQGPLHSSEVVVFNYSSCPFRLGSGREAYGSILEDLGTLLMVEFINIQFGTHHRFQIPKDNCIYRPIFEQHLSSYDGPKPDAKFAVDNIVYLKPNAARPANQQRPALGSKYESDLKIISVIPTAFKFSYSYLVYAPNAGEVIFYEEDLVSPADKIKYTYADYSEAVVINDMSPFFAIGDKVIMYNNLLHNQDHSVIVPFNAIIANNILKNETN